MNRTVEKACRDPRAWPASGQLTRPGISPSPEKIRTITAVKHVAKSAESVYDRPVRTCSSNPYTSMNTESDHSRANSELHRRRNAVVFVAVVAIVIAGLRVILPEPPRVKDLLQEARTAFSKQQFEKARTLAGQVIEYDPQCADAVLIQANAALGLGRCTEAEQALRQVLQRVPDHVGAHETLVLLLRMQARYWELRPHALALLRAGNPGTEFLIPLAAPDEISLSETDRRQAELFHASTPDDSSVLLGVARDLVLNSRHEQAFGLLTDIIRNSPGSVEAQVQLGALLLKEERAAEFVEWHRRLPATAQDHPQTWFLRGDFAASQSRPEEAARCYWEAVRRNPDHRHAVFQLSQTLRLIGEDDSANVLLERFRRLEEVARLATRGNDDSGNDISAETMYRIAELLEELGRLRESAAWCQQAMKRDNAQSAGTERYRTIVQRIDDSTPLTLSSAIPELSADLSRFPLSELTARDSPELSDSADVSTGPVFIDKASELGLSFQFFNGAEPDSGLARMFEFSGGGVGVIDFDGDSWPDVYLTQGTSWPPTPNEHHDALFRNRRGQQFVNVAQTAGCDDDRYSQGLSAGDFNNDGFVDLAVANIGQNRLYRNNGDGTFTDVTISAGITGGVWSSGCLLADVNNDGLPDLYHLNYLGGRDVFTRRCEREGRPIQCPLHTFPSEQDRLFINAGDGRFHDATQSSGIECGEGKGLGIVAADFDGSGSVSIFVANDDTPNFYFVRSTTPENGGLFSDHGVSSGLAFGREGEAQSCMGVAAGDPNNDGLLDLFVTNYTNEPNNLFVQRNGRFFFDEAGQAGLGQPGTRPMGWGTQFIDGDLDGLPDLIVANGHLDLNTAGNSPFRMRAQYFRNLGEGGFDEIPYGQAGPYFSGRRAGRAVARIDWNRDGADDVCVTHVQAATALLTSQNQNQANHLSIRLHANSGSRDGIGSVVRVTAGDRVLFRHIVGGDGFQAQNERKLTFGLGNIEQVDELEIRWPSGLKQKLTAPPVNSELVVIEGREFRTLPE